MTCHQAWLAAHPGWDVVPDQNLEEEEEGEGEEGAEDAERTGEEPPTGEGSAPTVKTHAVDDEYKKAEGEANYYRYWADGARDQPSPSPG